MVYYEVSFEHFCLESKIGHYIEWIILSFGMS
jgi:hypothetical protein